MRRCTYGTDESVFASSVFSGACREGDGKVREPAAPLRQVVVRRLPDGVSVWCRESRGLTYTAPCERRVTAASDGAESTFGYDGKQRRGAALRVKLEVRQGRARWVAAREQRDAPVGLRRQQRRETRRRRAL